MIYLKTFSQFINEINALSDLRGAAAKATMAGPSKEAQSLMSTRTKNILGPEKLSAGIKAQQGVETMISSAPVPKVTPASVQQSNNSSVRSNVPVSQPASVQQSNNSSVRSNVPVSVPLNPQQQGQYQQAYSNRNNPLARGRIQSEFSRLTPEQQKSFRDYAKSQNHDWGNLI